MSRMDRSSTPSPHAATSHGSIVSSASAGVDRSTNGIGVTAGTSTAPFCLTLLNEALGVGVAVDAAGRCVGTTSAADESSELSAVVRPLPRAAVANGSATIITSATNAVV